MSAFPRVPLSDLVIDDRPKRSSGDSRLWNLNLDQIEPNTGRVLERMWVKQDELGPSTYPFEAETVLYSKLRPYLNKVVVADEAGYATTELVPLRCNREMVFPQYLAYFLRSADFLAFATAVVAGAKMPRMVMSEFWRYEAPIPPLPEQRRIAAILDKADALLTKRRETLAQLDRLAQAIFVEMFGGIESIYSKWQTKSLDELLDFLTSGSRGWAEFYAETGSLFLRIQNVSRDKLDLSDVAFVSPPASAEAKRTEVQEGDVLLSITADLGRTAVVPKGLGKAHINQHLSILRTTAVTPRFLSAFLSSPAGKIQVMGRNKQGVKAGLNFDDIRSFQIPMPPQSMQHEFIRRVECVEETINLQKRSMNELSSVFRSLQHRAFRGEL